MSEHTTFCRICYHLCGSIVEIDDVTGRPVSMRGDKNNPLYKGYACVKGRASPAMHNSADRLFHSVKRRSDGSFERIDVEQAMDEIADALKRIMAESGPRAIGGYYGTGTVGGTFVMPFADAFFRSIESPMVFGSESIDQPGKTIAKGLHGNWMAPSNGWVEPEAILLIGVNPLVSHNGFPFGNPNTWLTGRLAQGMQLIVIDPRRTETARKATHFVQPRPGHDAEILAAIARVIIDEQLFDAEFAAANTSGLEQFRESLEPFAPEVVAQSAGVDPEALIDAARLYASARRGYVLCGTGPGMSGSSTLIEYLRMCVETLCGHYCREGETVPLAGVLFPTTAAKAQANPPFPSWGEAFGGPQSRVRGLWSMFAGSAPMPTSVAADEMLMPGPGQIRAFFSMAGNPVAAWPDQQRTIAALTGLDLHVALDVKLTATTRLADYIIATKMHLETSAVTMLAEGLTFYGTGVGTNQSYGQYAPAVASPPEDSQLIEDWEFFHGIARRLGLDLSIKTLSGSTYAIDMQNKPSGDELIEAFVAGSRIPLEELKRHPHGAIFPAPDVVVAGKDEGWTGRLNFADPDMMADLAEVALRIGTPERDEHYPFKLISRRMRHFFNSIGHAATRGTLYNPAFMNPHDIEDLGLAEGDLVEIASPHGSIIGVVESDPGLREELVSMAHCFGSDPQSDEAVREIGSPTSRLIDVEDDFERYSGQPRMSSVPVKVNRLTPQWPAN